MPNTEAAKNARKNAQGETEEKLTESGDEKMKEDDDHVQGNGKNEQSPSRGTKKRTNGDERDSGEATAEDEDGKYNEAEDEPAAKIAKTNEGSKLKTRSSMRNDQPAEIGAEEEKAKGKGKTNGKANSSNDDHGKPGSKDRLPDEGQKVHWKAGAWAEGISQTHWARRLSKMTDYELGTVVTILRSETDYEGLHAKASEDDPRIVVKSAKSGKHAVHKPDKVFW